MLRISMASRFWNRQWRYAPRKQKNDPSKREQFVFIHVPKTAGTTFRFILYNHFRPKDLYPTQAEVKNNGGQYLNPKLLIQRQKYVDKSLIIGHFHINWTNKFENKHIRKMAFFRNPLDRVLSSIKHFKAHKAEFHNADINEILESNWDRIVFGQSISMGFNMKNRNMKLVRQNIIDLDFIGITEYFDESIQLCNATFNWKLENIEPKNVIEDQIFNQLSTKSKMKIMEDLGPEMNTYNVAITQFRHRCKLHNIELN